METKICHGCGATIKRAPNRTLTDWNLRRFCTRSCAATYNNHAHPKRKKLPDRYSDCSVCKTPFLVDRKHPRRVRCNRCSRLEIRLGGVIDRTKGELFSKRTNWQSARSAIQKHARKVYTCSGRPMKCVICGYDFHVDIAHKKSVSSFPDSALIQEINDSENLEALCPNCHFEFDEGHFSLL